MAQRTDGLHCTTVGFLGCSRAPVHSGIVGRLLCVALCAFFNEPAVLNFPVGADGEREPVRVIGIVHLFDVARTLYLPVFHPLHHKLVSTWTLWERDDLELGIYDGTGIILRLQ